jgi:hypothetical protein
VSPASVEIKGSSAFSSSMDRAERDIADLREGFTKAGDSIGRAASRIAPRKTGALAGSIETMHSGPAQQDITSPLVYAGPIHWGVPSHGIEASLFILRGADQTESEWTRAIETDAQRVCDRVKGA